MHEPISSTLITYHGIAAIGGALAHAANAHRHGTSKSPLDFLLLVLMSSFSGVMFSLIGLHVFDHQIYLSMAMAGTGGYVGVEGMTLIITWLKNKFTK